jgi:Flp pilus assembly pilin Flp
MRTIGRVVDSLLLTVSVLLAYVHVRLEPLRKRSERGASAVEWAVITGITVAAAVAIGVVVWNKINAGRTLINTEIPGDGGGGGGAGGGTGGPP